MTSTLWVCTPQDDAAPAWHSEGELPAITLDVFDGATRWPAVQPGVLDASGGLCGHRVAARFEIAHATAALLVLQFSCERGPCPDLEITLDGAHRGLFHPTVVRADRTQTGEPGPVAGHVHLEVGFPAEWLTPGPHDITVTTALDRAAAVGEGALGATHEISYEPGESLPLARGHYGQWFGSYLRWSKVELRAVTSIALEPQVQLRPTPFFVRDGDAEAELVDVDVTWTAGTSPPDPVMLDWPYSCVTLPTTPLERDFGMMRHRVPVPSFDASSDVEIRLGDRVHRQQVTPCRRWTLHLIPHVHLDLGFTDAQGKVLELHCRNIDRALDRMAADPDFRFCVDGSVIAGKYLRTRPAHRAAAMQDAIAAGRLGVNAFHSNFLTGVVSLEELYRSTDLSMTLPRSRTTGLRYANLTDVPTYSRSTPTVLADLGIDGFVGMSNHARAATDTSDELHLLSPVRWQGPDGSEVLAHFADHYSQLRFIAADPQAVAGATDGLGRYLSRYERPDYLPADLAVIGTHADNEDLADGDTGFVQRWNAAFAWPRFRVSTFDEYLASVAPLVDRLPLWRSETGAYWEDGIGSAAAAFARYRTTQALLPAAETLGALVSAALGNVRTNRTELDRAWADLSIAAEHTLTWAHTMSHSHASPVADQLGWKVRYIDDAHRVAIDEMRRHLAQLSELAQVQGPGYLAYNPHAWTADLDAEIDLLDGVDVLGADGPLPIEILNDCAGMRRVRLHLSAMPPHAWRFLPVTAGRLTLPDGQAAPGAGTPSVDGSPGFVSSTTPGPIVSPAWRVMLDPVTALPMSLVHRPTGRELLEDGAPVRLGQIVRAAQTPFDADVSGVLSNPVDIHQHHRARSLSIENFRYVADPGPSDLVTQSPRLTYVGRKDTPDGMRLCWRGQGAGLDTVSIDLLLRDQRALCDLDVSFNKAPCLDMEAVYVCFPFAGTTPVLRYDRPLGWVCPSTEHGPGACNEWAAVTNTVSIQSNEGELRWTTLDAPLFCAGDVVRGGWPTRFPEQQGWLFSYVMNNFWPCNTPAWQPGPVRFRYRFEAATRYEPAASTRFGRTARVDAQVAEILPLDRFGPSDASVYREGSLTVSGIPQDIDIQVRQGHDPATLTMHLTNLTQVRVDIRPPATDRRGSGLALTAPASIAPFGVAHLTVPGAVSDGRLRVTCNTTEPPEPSAGPPRVE